MLKVQKPAAKTLLKTDNLEVPMKNKSKEKKTLALKKVTEQQFVKTTATDKKPAELEKVIKNKANEKPKKAQDKKTVAPKRPLVLIPPPPESQKPQKWTAKATTATPAPSVILTKKNGTSKKDKKVKAKRAFKKQQIKQNSASSVKRQKKIIPNIFEPISFDEDKFNVIVSVENITKIAKGLKQQVEQEVATKRTSIFSDYQYYLNVASFKILSCSKRMVKQNLKHSLIDPENDDVVIIVPDMERGPKIDYDPTMQHYDDLFSAAGLQGLKIMLFNQLRKECNTFETVRKYNQLHRGDLISIPVGNDKYTAKQLAENIKHVIAQLKTIYPGGLGNVRAMNLKIDITDTSSLPIYLSMAQPSAEIPYVVGQREERMLKLKKDANEILSHFTLNKLNKDQVKHKHQLNVQRAELLPESKNSLEQKDDDGEEIVPAKKPRTEINEVEVERNNEEREELEPPQEAQANVPDLEQLLPIEEEKRNGNHDDGSEGVEELDDDESVEDEISSSSDVEENDSEDDGDDEEDESDDEDDEEDDDEKENEIKKY